MIVARDGEETVKEFTANKGEVALILLDVVMPRLSGPEAYAKISETKPGVPVIFTSGYSEEIGSLKSMLGASALFLQKPYGPELLARKVRGLLDQKPKIN